MMHVLHQFAGGALGGFVVGAAVTLGLSALDRARRPKPSDRDRSDASAAAIIRIVECDARPVDHMGIRVKRVPAPCECEPPCRPMWVVECGASALVTKHRDIARDHVAFLLRRTS